MFKLVTFVVTLGVAFAAPKVPGARILGGNDTDIALNPWHIGLIYDGRLLCSGFLISNKSALTSAQCVLDTDIPLLYVRTGSTNISSGGETISLLRKSIHPSYNFFTLENDIAIIELANPVNNTNSKACSLPGEKDEIVAGSQVTITGWGITGTGYGSDILQAVNVTALDEATCKKAYENFTMTDNMFCAGTPGKGAALIDGGGPVTLNNTCVGIVSWGKDYAGEPWVNTKVSKYASWIASVINS